MENRSPIAVAVIVENENQILLIKEAKGTAEGKWNQPAGRLEVGENIQQAALREAQEETGYTIELKSLVGVYDELENQSKPRVRFVFTAKLLSNSRYFLLENLTNLAWSSVLESSQQYQLLGPNSHSRLTLNFFYLPPFIRAITIIPLIISYKCGTLRPNLNSWKGKSCLHGRVMSSVGLKEKRRKGKHEK